MRNAKFPLLTILFTLVTGVWQAGVEAADGAADGLYSLRGKRPINDISEAPGHVGVILPIKGVHDRSFKGQPPQVPHKVKAKRISIKKNQCLECHSDENYEEVGTTQIHRSHYVNRAGEKQGRVSTRFYFCNQCHVQQINKTPLVANLFRTTKSYRSQDLTRTMCFHCAAIAS